LLPPRQPRHTARTAMCVDNVPLLTSFSIHDCLCVP
jgi:hypothetical protein